MAVAVPPSWPADTIILSLGRCRGLLAFEQDVGAVGQHVQRVLKAGERHLRH